MADFKKIYIKKYDISNIKRKTKRNKKSKN